MRMKMREKRVKGRGLRPQRKRLREGEKEGQREGGTRPRL